MPTWRIPVVRPPEPGHPIRVDVEGTPLAVFSIGTRLLAVDARCTHVGGPLDRGSVAGVIVTCPLHGSQFDLETGAAVRGPAARPIKVYRARAELNDLVFETD
jgi:nitrite reductase/ring-hydroxylating ferredoxin subunit